MRVYKFLNAEYGIRALEECRLKISRINELNDPFELLGVDLSKREKRKAFRETKDELNENRGLICFSRRTNNPVLWSHYADKHRGLCLGFDVPDELLVRVTYTTKRTDSCDLFSDDPLVREAAMLRILSTKFSHWRYESEERCFVGLEDKDPDFSHYFADFSHRMNIKQVLVGPEASISRKDVEKALGKQNAHVERIKMRAAFKTFNVVRNKKQSLWK